MATVLIQNSRIFDGHRYLEGDVFIRDGIIETLGGVSQEKAGFTFDAAGMTVMPGLVDVHMHIKGFSPEKWAVPADCCLSFGVTAAAEATADFGGVDTARALGVKTCVFVPCDTRQTPGLLQRAEEALEKYGPLSAGIKTFYDADNDPELKSADPLAELSEFAHKKGYRLTVHTANSPIPMRELLAALNPGDIATHIFHGDGHTVAEDDFACLFEAKQRGVLLDISPAGTGHIDFSIFQNAIAAGALPDLIGTDLVWQILYTRGGRFGLTSCMTMARLLGMKEEDILPCVTANAGKALDRPWGVLTEGGNADIAVLEYGKEPFDMTDWKGFRLQSDLGYRCHLTIADGKIVYRR